MSETLNARRTRLSLSINGVDVGADLAPYLKDFSFKDNAKGKADEIQFSLMDRDGRFQKEWFIQKGCRITAQLTCLDWYKPGENIALPMGAFTVDEVELSGPPDLIRVKAVSAAKTSALSEEARTRGWETCTLQGIADEIAQRHGYELMYDAPEIPFDRVEQREASDLAFLHKTSSRYGVNLKVHDNKIILYGADAWDAKEPRFVIPKKGSPLSPASWSFKKGSQGTGKKAEIAYHDPAKGETITAGVAAPGAAPSGQTLTLNQRVENESQAIALGQGALRAANEGEHTADLDFMGLPGLAAGITVCLEGWGEYDGGYFVEAAEHKLSPAYSTSAELRKTLAPGTVQEESPPESQDKVETAPPAPVPGYNPVHLWEDAFERLWETLHKEDADGTRKLTDMDKLMLCLPSIAGREAERRDEERDRIGWNHLKSLFHKWFSGPANTDADGNPEPYWVDWDWVMSFERARTAYQEFTDPNSLNPPYILSKAAQNKLGEILLEQFPDLVTLPAEEAQEFHFTKAPWQEWLPKYHTQKLVRRKANTDGLMAAMAGFSLRALADGTIKAEENGKFTITVTSLGVFALDRFEFSRFGKFLGYWSCTDGTVRLLDVGDSAVQIWNNDFQRFRDKFKRGNDFLTLSNRHYVENFSEFSYVYP